MFLYSYAVALFRYVNGSGNVTNFLFDSHCRSSSGITDRESGFLVLINFDILFQIERYIGEAYQLSGRVYPPYFQIEFISANVNVDDLATVHFSQVSYFRKMKRQQKQAKENLHKKREKQINKNSRMRANCGEKYVRTLKVFKDLKKLRKLIGFIKCQWQEH